MTKRMRRAFTGNMCKYKFFACAYWVGLLMVLVRALHLQGEWGVGTKQGMKIGFMDGTFLLIHLVKGRSN